MARFGLIPNSACAPPGVRAEPGHDFVEYQRGSRIPRDLPQLVEKLHRLELRPAALHRLHEHGRQLPALRAHDVERGGAAVFQHHDVLDRAGDDPRGRRHRTKSSPRETVPRASTSSNVP